MNGYLFALSCPYDAGTVTHHASTRASTWETRAVGQCESCGAELVVVVTLLASQRDGRGGVRTPAKLAAMAKARAARGAA